MDTTGGKGRPTNLYDKFVATRDERFQAYADQALLDQGIDPTQLGADWKQDSTMKDVLAQIEDDFEAQESLTDDIFNSPPSSIPTGSDGKIPKTRFHKNASAKGRAPQRLMGRESGAYMMNHTMSGDQTGLALITTAAQVFEGSLCVSDTDQVAQGATGAALVLSAAQWIANKEKSDPFFKIRCQILVKSLTSKTGLDLRLVLTDFMNQVVGSQQISGQLFLRVLVCLITKKAEDSVIADHTQEFLEQMFRMTLDEQDQFWALKSRTAARRADLITGAPFLAKVRFGLQAFTDTNAGYHCAHAFVGLVDYLCYDAERETDLMKFKAEYTLLSAQERGTLPVQTESPLLQKIHDDGSLEKSVDWAAREMKARQKLNAAATLLDRKEEVISADLDIIQCMRLSMRPVFMKLLDKLLLEGNGEWRKMNWKDTFDVMKLVDVKLRLMKEQKDDLRARTARFAALPGTTVTQATRPNGKKNSSYQQRHDTRADRLRQQRGVDQSFATDESKCSSCGRNGHRWGEQKGGRSSGKKNGEEKVECRSV